MPAAPPARHPTRRALTRLLLFSGVAALLAAPGCAVWRLSRSAQLTRRSEPYRQHPEGATRRLLVVGDSTAVGTGASTPAHSLAGLIGAALPKLEIEHRGEDGARMADLPQQMQGASRCDALLIQCGGNDVIRLRDRQALLADVESALRLARTLAPVVWLMPCGNVGNAPFFFPPLSTWMTRRSRALQRLCADAARRHGAVHIDLFRERAEDPFVREPGLNAADGLHPSDAGYERWWQALQAQADVFGALHG